jgi:hypothetical protein
LLFGVIPVHQVEQRRRERAKECFDEIRRMLPAEYDIKPDKNSILQAVIKHIEDLRLRVRGALQPHAVSMMRCFTFYCQPPCSLHRAHLRALWSQLKAP